MYSLEANRSEEETECQQAQKAAYSSLLALFFPNLLRQGLLREIRLVC